MEKTLRHPLTPALAALALILAALAFGQTPTAREAFLEAFGRDTLAYDAALGRALASPAVQAPNDQKLAALVRYLELKQETRANPDAIWEATGPLGRRLLLVGTVAVMDEATTATQTRLGRIQSIRDAAADELTR